MRVVFLGTDAFAVPTLTALATSDHDLVGVVTGPDKPAGRGRTLQPTPVRRYMLDTGLDVPVLMPAKLKDPAFHAEFRALKADVAVVVAFRILPPAVFDAPTHGTLNVHPSLLPKYRGPAPLNWALIEGETVTGVSVIRITSKVDAGGVLAQRTVELDPDETAGELAVRLAPVGGEMVLECLTKLEHGEDLPPVPQDETLVTRAPKLSKEDGRIDWDQPAIAVHNRVRGLTPWPGAFSSWDGRMLKLFATRAIEIDDLRDSVAADQLPTALAPQEPGTVLVADPKRDSLVIACGDGALVADEVQLQGKRRMASGDFLRGVPLKAGMRLGDGE